MAEKENDKEINIGCGCLTDVIALFLLIVILDLLGCEWCSGFTERCKDVFRTDKQAQNIRPSDLR